MSEAHTVPGEAGGGSKIASSTQPLTSFWADWSLAIPLIVLATCALVLPCVVLIRASFAGPGGAGFTLANWAAVLASGGMRRAIVNSLLLGFAVATISMIVGTPLAWAVSRMPRVRRSLHLGMLNVATNFSGIGLGFAYFAALGTYGMITLSLQRFGLNFQPPAANGFSGLIVAYIYGNVPLFVLFSLPAMSLVKDEWQEAAKTCGASAWQFWQRVGFPVIRPFVLASWLLIFTWSVGLYGLPVALVGEAPLATKLITVEMNRSLLGSLFGSQRMPVLAVILMILALASLILYRIIVRRGTKWLS
ncbi:hypothetical protein ASC97_31355 [Rhizobium sp. Root1203]|uniref:hypothetical protein n=1 Tax=Rhizobium sp. Root1203 TaxID=1736427 RepID=UPI000708F622|nr:hypothetical protein [Rhizobium sp. Root1203]KQV15299.1 hypothetical protein ASC97_31355 [Rhizobium sp. Root1203]